MTETELIELISSLLQGALGKRVYVEHLGEHGAPARGSAAIVTIHDSAFIVRVEKQIGTGEFEAQ